MAVSLIPGPVNRPISFAKLLHVLEPTVLLIRWNLEVFPQ